MPAENKTERDSLLARPASASSSNCQTISNWVLAFVVSLLTITLIINNGKSSPLAPLKTSPVAAESNTSFQEPPVNYSPHTEGRYYATQFISFTINTLGGSASNGECEGRPIDPKADACYLGNDDIETDVNRRLAIFADVLRILRNDVFKEEPEIDRDPRVLKILMLPEFFLRGPTGAYSTDEMFESREEKGELIKLLDKIREMISDLGI